MRPFAAVLLVSVAVVLVADGAHSLVGVFEGANTLRSNRNRVHRFSSPELREDKWSLFLYRDATNGNPTAYSFKGTRTTREDRWRIERGAGGDRNWVIYHLYDQGPVRVLSLLRVDDNVLLLLDRDLKVLVGDASWSYTLNRSGVPDRDSFRR